MADEDLSKPAFRYPSSGKRPERLNQSRDVNVPLQLARGWAAGTLGLPGDIESLVRLLPGLDETPVLPTSDFYREWLPGYDPKPAAQAMSGLGALAGGVGATKVAREGVGAVKRATDVDAIKRYIRSAQQSSGLPGSQVIKPKGGNWLTGDVERQTERLKQVEIDRDVAEELGIGREAENTAALNNWVDKKLNKYIKNEMGTPEDPVRALAERGVLHFEPQQVFGDAPSTLMRKRAGVGMPTPLFGKSETARRWEALADRAIDPYPAGSYKYGSLDENFRATNPWLEKVPDEALVYKAKGLQREMGFDHLIDELRNSVNPESGLPANLRWSAKDLEKVTVPQAVERVAKINEWRAAQKAEADAAKARNPATFVVKEYPEQKMQWVELKTPEGGELPEGTRRKQSSSTQGGLEVPGVGFVEAKYDPKTGLDWEKAEKDAKKLMGRKPLEDALKYEGETMGHCVGGYCPDVMEGRSRIYSLRDKKGEPHVTIEAQPMRNYGAEAARMKMAGASDEEIAAFFANPPQEITQIKGKGNRAPKEEYLPMVQDFVRGGNWSQVGDLKNTGLYRKGDFIDEFSPDQLDAAGKGEYLTMDEIKKLREGKAWKPIDTDASWGDVQADLPPPNYAEGGPVSLASITDKIADQLMLTGMDRDQAILQASRMADAKMQEQKMAAGGFVKLLKGAAKGAEKGAEATKTVEKAATKAPRDEALETARKNAVKMLGLPENNTAMDRAKALGFDTDAYHATGADFRSFKINPYRGAVSVAATPSGAMKGSQAGAADLTGSGRSSIIPLLMRSQGIQGLSLPKKQQDFFSSLPNKASEAQVEKLMEDAPKGAYWSTFFTEVKNADGTFSYIKKLPPKMSFADVQKTQRGADSMSVANWGDESWTAKRVANEGDTGWLQRDESGISASIVDPTILRSRFAAFDPARVNENDLLGRADPRLLGALAAGTAGATMAGASRDRQKEEKKKDADKGMAAGGAVRRAAQAAVKAAEKAAEAKQPVPLVLPPAKPMTKEEMRPIAQRMASQMTGEFVRPDPKMSFNPAGKSRKIFEREKNLPVGVVYKAPETPAPIVDIEKQQGSVLVGVPGDPTIGSAARAGTLMQVPVGTAELKRLGDVELEQGVQLFGGPRYGAGMPDQHFWASGLGAARAIQNRITDLSKVHEAPVLGQYIKMSPESTNFALHNLDALLAYQQPEKLSKTKREMLEREIRKGSPKYGSFPGFAGFDDPIDVLLQAQVDSNLRKHVAETLMKPTVTEKLGLRPGSDVLFGITEPSLRNIETGASGFSVGKMAPGADLSKYPTAHPTYDVDIPGQFIGQTKYPIPAEVAFPSSMSYARSQLKPGVQEFNMLKFIGPREKIDQQYIDQMKMYEELMKEYTGKKKGGAVKKPKAGALAQATR
jgi:hypothetical protein